MDTGLSPRGKGRRAFCISPSCPELQQRVLLLTVGPVHQDVTFRARSVSCPLQKSLAQCGCLGGWGGGPSCRKTGLNVPITAGVPLKWRVRLAPADGHLRPAAYRLCVWVALRLCVLPFPMSWLPLLASCLPFPPSVVPGSHGFSQRAGRVSLLVRDFVTQAQSNAILSPGRNA